VSLSSHEAGPLERVLRAQRDKGRKLLVPYVTGGYDDDWLDVVRAVAAAGADAIEVGLPFSDPVMDGPVIQEASVRALERGTTPAGIIAALANADVGIPIAVMSYVNPIAHLGYRRAAMSLAASNIAGAIVPDLPLDEADEWREEAAAAGVDAVQLVAPTTPDERMRRICAAARGFVYAVGLLGVTGERGAVADSALLLAKRAKLMTDMPVLVGVGISTPDQAVAVSAVADGVIVGSALVRRLLEGEGPSGAATFVQSLRDGLDASAT
jgi:tryptophan synthase alpha chain